MDSTLTKLYYGKINVTWQWHQMVLAQNRISALFGIFF